MFYIIGRIFTNDNLRVIDTMDKELTDISEDELVSMINSGTIIENAEVLNGRIVTKPFSIEKYGYVGEDLVYTVLSEGVDTYEICSQDGKVIQVKSSELVRVAMVYGLTNYSIDKIGDYNYIRSSSVYYQTVTLHMLDNKEKFESAVEVGRDTWLNITINEFSYRILLKSCSVRTKDKKYYYGVLESCEMGDFWEFVNGQDYGIGVCPYLAVYVEYCVSKKRFTSAVASLNISRESLYKPKLVGESKLKVNYTVVDESNGLCSFSKCINIEKGKYITAKRELAKC